MIQDIYDRVMFENRRFRDLRGVSIAEPSIALIAQAISLLVEDPRPNWTGGQGREYALQYLDQLQTIFEAIAEGTRGREGGVIETADVLRFLFEPRFQVMGFCIPLD